MAAQDLCSFIDASPSPFHAVAEAARRLEAAGFKPIDETGDWSDAAAASRFVVRDGSLVAWAGVEPGAPLRLAAAHTDSPNLRVKPRPDGGRAGARQLAVEPYGGVLLNSWLGRDLGLSGRVAVRSGELRPVRDDRPVLHIPQLAIHLDREVGAHGLKLDPQSHLTPVWGVGSPDSGGFARYLTGLLDVSPDEIVAWDVMTHDLAPSTLAGPDEELVSAPRLDNLCSAWAAVSALISSGQGVVALFDHEEVGSETSRGAGSPLVGSVLERLHGDRELLHRSLAGSMCVSSDMAHATHPNYPDRHEPGHWIELNGGPVIKTNVNQRYATDARSAQAFVAACEDAGVPHQWYAHRADLPCGSTIGPITAARLGIPVVDVGAPQLAMHSARELMGSADPAMLRDALAAFLAR
ncbi:MAG: M18 family aminopeptidase [Acidimicrobiales bacterium]